MKPLSTEEFKEGFRKLTPEKRRVMHDFLVRTFGNKQEIYDKDGLYATVTINKNF